MMAFRCALTEVDLRVVAYVQTQIHALDMAVATDDGMLEHDVFQRCKTANNTVFHN